MSMKAELLMVKGMISELDEEEQAAYRKCKDELDEFAKQHGDPFVLALAVTSAEIAIEQGE